MNLLLIDNRVNDIDVVLNSLLSTIDYVIIDFQNDTFDSIQIKINEKTMTYEHIGIFQENYDKGNYKFVDSFEASILTDVEVADPELTTWTHYIDMIAYFKNSLGMTTLDLMGCNIMNDPNWGFVTGRIETALGIVINSSSDYTGSAEKGGNWILESSNANLIGLYFTENISNYKFVLGILDEYLRFSSTSNKYTSYYLQGFLDISGDFIKRQGPLYLPPNSMNSNYLSTNIRTSPFNNVLTGLSTCSGGLRVTNGCTIDTLNTVPSSFSYSNSINLSSYVNSNNIRSISITSTYMNVPGGYYNGLFFSIHDGYMGDNNNFVKFLPLEPIPVNTGIVTSIPSVSVGTNNIVPENDSWETYSVMWHGYFKPDVTGLWTFVTISDDASYLWVGDNARDTYTMANATVNNGGFHSNVERSGSIQLIKDVYYYIRIIFGEAGGGDNMRVEFIRPGTTTRITDGTNFYFHDLPLRQQVSVPSAVDPVFTNMINPNVNASYVSAINLNVTSMTTTRLFANTGNFRAGAKIKLIEIKMPTRTNELSQVSNTVFGTDILIEPITNDGYAITMIGYDLLSSSAHPRRCVFYGSNLGNINTSSYRINLVYIGGDIQMIANVEDNTCFGYKTSPNYVWISRQTLFGVNLNPNGSTSYPGGSDITCIGNSCALNNFAKSTNNSYFGSFSDSFMNTSQNFNNSTTIGAYSQFTDSNQIVIGTTNQRLFVRGAYVGIQKYIPNIAVALDINGSMAVSGRVTTFGGTTTGTLNPISTNIGTYTTIDNSINLVKVYNFDIGGTTNNTGIGVAMFNGGNTSGFNTMFGNYSTQLGLTAISNTLFGFNNVAGFSGAASNRALFGYNIRSTSSNQSAFGAYVMNTAGSGGENMFLGAFSGYKIANPNNTGAGFECGYNSTDASFNSYLGSRAGYFQVIGGNNTYIGANTGQISGNVSSYLNSTAIGASAITNASNQITMGTTAEQLFIPGTYVGVGKFAPGLGYALDVSGNALISNSLVANSIVTTFPTSMTLNTMFNTINSVRLYNDTAQNIGIGFQAFNSLTGGTGRNSLFGHYPNEFTSESSDCIYGCRFIAPTIITPVANHRCLFGVNIIRGGNASTVFGPYIDCGGNQNGNVNTIFGSRSYFSGQYGYGGCSSFGFESSFASLNPFRNTNFGYRAGTDDSYANAQMLSIGSNARSSGTGGISIGANAIRSGNAVFGTTSERLFVPGAYVGIQKFATFPANRIVAGGEGTLHTLAYSSDGITWTGNGKTIFTGVGRGVAWDGIRWVAVGEGGNTIAHSLDGITWTGLGSSIFSTRGTFVNWNGVRWVAVGQGTNSIAYSSDGITWTGIGTSIFTDIGFAVASNITRLVAVGIGTNTIAHSLDGITWTGIGTSIFSSEGRGIAWNGTRFVAVGSGTNTIAYSSDGLSWTGVVSSPFSTRGLCVAWNGTMFVAGGQGTNTLAHSTDGITWTGVVGSPFTTYGFAIEWCGDKWVAGGFAGSSLAYSTNGTTWIGITPANSPFSTFCNGVGWNKYGIQRYALDVNGNAQFSNTLQIINGTLTTNNVRIYSNPTRLISGIGFNAFNSLTTGTGMVSFGNNQWAASVTTGSFNTAFGYTTYTPTSTAISYGTTFGAFTSFNSSLSCTFFGAYSNPLGLGNSTMFGGFCMNAKATDNGAHAVLGHRAGFNSNTGAWSTFAGFQAGQFDIAGSYNTHIGANSGQLTSNTSTIIQSAAIGASARIDVSNQIVFGSTSERLFVPGSYVGIARFTPGQGYLLDVGGNMRISQGNLVVSGTGTSTSWPVWSDYRIKQDIKPLTEAYTSLNLNPVKYKNELSDKQDIGFIAHEVASEYPELVFGEKDGDEYQSVNYSGVIPILTREIKDIKYNIYIQTSNVELLQTRDIVTTTHIVSSIELSQGTWAICYQISLDMKTAINVKNLKIGLSINNNKQLHNIYDYEIIGEFLYSNMEIETFDRNTVVELIVEYDGVKGDVDMITSDSHKNYLIYKKMHAPASQ